MKLKKYGGIASLPRFGSDGESVIIGHKKVDSKLKRINSKIISICYHYYRSAIAVLSFFKESTNSYGKKK